MKYLNHLTIGLIVCSAIATNTFAGMAAFLPSTSSIDFRAIAQTSKPETSAAELKSWCSLSGGIWLGKSCEWQSFLEEELEVSLDGQCRDRGGVWQTLYEEIIVPNCQGDVCTLEIDADNIEYVETGVGCIWEDESGE